MRVPPPGLPRRMWRLKAGCLNKFKMMYDKHMYHSCRGSQAQKSRKAYARLLWAIYLARQQRERTPLWRCACRPKGREGADLTAALRHRRPTPWSSDVSAVPPKPAKTKRSRLRAVRVARSSAREYRQASTSDHIDSTVHLVTDMELT